MLARVTSSTYCNCFNVVLDLHPDCMWRGNCRSLCMLRNSAVHAYSSKLSCSAPRAGDDVGRTRGRGKSYRHCQNEWTWYGIFLLWRYSPTWALASAVLRVQSSLFSASYLQFLHFSILLASLSAASLHLPLGLPTCLLPFMYPFSAFSGAHSSFIPTLDPPVGIFSIWNSWLACYGILTENTLQEPVWEYRGCTSLLSGKYIYFLLLMAYTTTVRRSVLKLLQETQSWVPNCR